MDSLDQLRAKLNLLVTKYEQLAEGTEALKEENSKLRLRVSELERQTEDLAKERANVETGMFRRNRIARDRISRLVKKVDQLRGELEFS